MNINTTQKQMELLEAVIRGAAYNGPPYWRYRRACIRYRRARSRFAPGSQLRHALGTNNYQRRRNSTVEKLPTKTTYTSTETTCQRTQTRSWAPSGPVRISNAQQSCVPATALSS